MISRSRPVSKRKGEKKQSYMGTSNMLLNMSPAQKGYHAITLNLLFHHYKSKLQCTVVKRNLRAYHRNVLILLAIHRKKCSLLKKKFQFQKLSGFSERFCPFPPPPNGQDASQFNAGCWHCISSSASLIPHFSHCL